MSLQNNKHVYTVLIKSNAHLINEFFCRTPATGRPTWLVWEVVNYWSLINNLNGKKMMNHGAQCRLGVQNIVLNRWGDAQHSSHKPRQTPRLKTSKASYVRCQPPNNYILCLCPCQEWPSHRHRSPYAPWCTRQAGGAQRRSMVHNAVLYSLGCGQCTTQTDRRDVKSTLCEYPSHASGNGAKRSSLILKLFLYIINAKAAYFPLFCEVKCPWFRVLGTPNQEMEIRWHYYHKNHQRHC